MEGIVLREATEEDAATVLAVRRAANEPYRHRPGGPRDVFEDTVEGTRSKMAGVPVVLAIADGAVIGCLFYAQEDDHCYLFRLAVLPAYQRRGVGRALLEYAEDRARAMGLAATRLGVFRSMQENRAYYERLGYRVVEETETGTAMEKQLGTYTHITNHGVAARCSCPYSEGDTAATSFVPSEGDVDEITLREATEADAATVLAVQRAANAPFRHRPDGPVGAFHDTVEGKRTVMETVPVVLAVAGDVVVGCLFYAREGDHCHLSNLAVLPAYQRRGIGRALLAYAEDRASDMGLAATRLGVRRSMPENRAYYERLGYRVIEEAATGVVMEKRRDP